MKQLELKSTTITVQNAEGELIKNANYLDLITHCLNVPPPNGYSPDEMRQRMRIEDVVQKAANEKAKLLKLEDADAKKLKQVCNSVTWQLMSHDLIGFIDAVDGMDKAEKDKDGDN